MAGFLSFLATVVKEISPIGCADQGTLPGLLDLPEGFRYQPNLIDADTEPGLIREPQKLDFSPFQFHGFQGKRRVVSFGWRYDFNGGGLQRTDPLPPFLLPIRDAAAASFGLEGRTLEQALIIEYGPGASIGWHKDRPVFGDVIGISLLSPCTFRFRRKTGTKWSVRRSRQSRGPPIFCRVPHATIGSTASRQFQRSATRSRSGVFATNNFYNVLRGPSGQTWPRSNTRFPLRASENKHYRSKELSFQHLHVLTKTCRICDERNALSYAPEIFRPHGHACTPSGPCQNVAGGRFPCVPDDKMGCQFQSGLLGGKDSLQEAPDSSARRAILNKPCKRSPVATKKGPVERGQVEAHRR